MIPFEKILGMFDKLDDIIYKPIELVTSWASEPLKQFEENRKRETERLMKENETKQERDLSDIRINEKTAELNLQIRKETEVQRIYSEIEEWKKDKELNRMRSISEAIVQYQNELAKINIEAINAIGNMQLVLREKAQNIVYEKTIRYKELQRQASMEALEDFKKIEEQCPDNEIMKTILINSIGDRLATIINSARSFLLELNKDISNVNENINILTQNGQAFIERYLERVGRFDIHQNELNRLTK